MKSAGHMRQDLSNVKAKLSDKVVQLWPKIAARALAAEELELRVRERTLELRESEHRLRLFALELVNAEERERKRIAQEIHDGLSSQLAALKYYLESTAPSNLDSAERERRIERTGAMIRGAIEETRRIMADLRPSILDELGILPTITWFCREFQELHPAVLTSVKIEVREEEIPDSIKTVIFRLLREALNFLQETIRAGTVRISLRRTGSSIHFQISDDGGAEVQAEALSRKEMGHGFGLRGMRERVELSGGKCEIESSPAKGVAIRAEWRIKP